MRWYQVLALVASVSLAGCVTSVQKNTGGKTVVYGHTTAAPQRQVYGSPRPSALPRRGSSMPPVAVTELHSAPVTSLAPPSDIWDRMRRRFAIPDLNTDLVRQQEQRYASRPDYIPRMVERSRRYIFHIVEELELRDMPLELALLPYIESAFNPQAVSSAKAAGMWQFMPSTGRNFQLTQNVLRDDRRDVLDSTRAALDYLQQLYAMFGDWHLALAAYNWGEGSVKRAIDRNRAAGRGTGYLDLDMPRETRNYVPKLQAMKNIIANPQAYGVVLPLIANHPFFDTVEITHDIDVAVAARMAGVRLEDFQALNPSQIKPVIFAAGTPQILLPWDNASIFKQNLSKAAPGTLASWTAWVAPATLSPGEVASRFNMDEAQLRNINGLPRGGVLIKTGSTVIVRRGDDAATTVDSQVVNNAQLTYTPEIVLHRITVLPHKGDTIASVAARYDLPANTVAGWNQTQPHVVLKPGQTVTLLLPVRASTHDRTVDGTRGTTRTVTRRHSIRRHPAPVSRKARRRR
ncbi:MAG: transglycosylase SLT domain-containing protein [Burkholderiaceae bacterium]|jgi:membrane-bound lytic murein transglycosylase D|nr:transglycosylase SLT domain-containing protein [Burkholderiaceae bacterium]